MIRTAVETSNRLPSAKEAMERLALEKAKKASEALRQKEKADAQKNAQLDQLSKPSGISEQEAFKAGGDHHRACGEQRADRGGGFPISERAVHRWRPRHQQCIGAWLGEHADRLTARNVSVLESSPAAARIQDPR